MGLCGQCQYGTLWSGSEWDFVVGVSVGLCSQCQYATLHTLSGCGERKSDFSLFHV